MNKSSKRLENEFKALSKNPVYNCIVELPDPNNIHKWTVHMAGPEGTAYEEGVFTLSFVFPDNYPFKCPDVKFVTPMYHPNIKKDTGEICMDVFASTSLIFRSVLIAGSMASISMLNFPFENTNIYSNVCQ